jgi:hypothetical protein
MFDRLVDDLKGLLPDLGFPLRWIRKWTRRGDRRREKKGMGGGT